MKAETKLSAYAAKRDFQKTAEPKDASGVLASDHLRFVVQRHDARRLHYDLRLEVDGVFKSWAVAKGPSLNPADKRLAVEVEDHPLGYGDFEGTIPAGEYGGGTVQLFDRGTWAPEAGMSPAEALRDGELKFALDGKRLKGSFVLVRMKGDKFGGKRTNWLLIKHRDRHARETPDGGGALDATTSVASGRTLAAIAAGRGKAPKAFMLAAKNAPPPDAIWDSSRGLAEAERRATDDPKAAPTARARPRRDAALGKTAAMPGFVEPQLCRSVAKPPAGKNWIHEIKFDGYRIQLRVEGGTAALLTRNGLDWTKKFGAIARAASRLPDCVVDGEIVALDGSGLPDFAALQAAIANETTDDLAFFAFDLLHRAGRDLRGVPVIDRKGALAALLQGVRGEAGRKRLRRVEHFEEDGAAVFATARTMGLEGIVSKRRDATYRSGRSESWTKVKCRPGHEVVLGGWTETNGKFRSLLAGVFREGKLVYLGRVGTGFGASTLAALQPVLDEHRTTKRPYTGALKPAPVGKVHWLEPVLVAEIEFAGWSSDGLVRQASFKGLRSDKPATAVATEAPSLDADGSPAVDAAAEPSRDRAPRAEASTATKTKSGGGTRGKAAVMGVTLSHPDKALWPDAGDGVPVTKADLARYFEAVGAWMMPHVAGRPCSIIRAPDGIDGQTFFQRHAMAGGSALFDTTKIAGDREPYLLLNHVEALAAVAQSGGLELHPSNCAPGEPDVPGRLVFDLDPAPDVAFAQVVETARTMREVLAMLGLESFCKTTGGKGLHVVTPLAVPASGQPISWDAAKQFAHDVCRVLESDAPGLYLTKASKAARKGRIYLDYLRNDRLATAVAPLSPRARAHAPVSMPLTWPQVKAGLDPSRFTLRTVPGLLKRSKAWDGYEAASRPLAEAMDRLATL